MGDCSVCTVFKASSYIWVMNELLGLTESNAALFSFMGIGRDGPATVKCLQFLQGRNASKHTQSAR